MVLSSRPSAACWLPVWVENWVGKSPLPGICGGQCSVVRFRASQHPGTRRLVAQVFSAL